MNKETIEEAAERTFTPSYTNYKVRRQGFKEGAKWQAERMYSEGEVLKIILARNAELGIIGKTSDAKQWFEQFKKK